jgi:hypothetical protein
MYIVAPGPISTAIFIGIPPISLCVCMCISVIVTSSVKCIRPFDTRQRLGKHVPTATNTRRE